MAFRFKTQAPPTEKPSFLKRLWGFVPSVVRGVSGFASGTGGPTGALISGAGEAAAELLEGDIPDIRRVAVEAGIGLIPGAKITKAGRIAESIAKGGILGGVGAGARQIASADPETPILDRLDGGGILTGAAIGGAAGGAAAKFFSPKKGPVPKDPSQDYIIETTAQPGGEVLSGGKVVRGAGTKPDVLKGAKNAPVIPPAGPLADYGTPSSGPIGVEPPIPGLTPKAPVPQMGTPAEASGRVRKIIDKETFAKAAEQKKKDALNDSFMTALAKRNLRYDEEEATAADIANAIAKGELVGNPPKITETVEAPVPGGKQRMTTSFSKPDTEDAGKATTGSSGKKTPGRRKVSTRILPPQEGPAAEVYKAWISLGIDEETAIQRTIEGISPVPVQGWSGKVVEQVTGPKKAPDTPTTPEPTVPPTTPQVDTLPTGAPTPVDTPGTSSETPTSPLLQILKGRVDAAGQAFRSAKADPTTNPLALRQLGIGLSSEASKAGLPTKVPVKPDTLAKFLGDKISPEIAGTSPTGKAPSGAKAPAATPPVETTPPPTQDYVPSTESTIPGNRPMSQAEVDEQLGLLEKFKGIASEDFKKGNWGSEEGAASVDAMASILTGLGGAAIGAAVNPFDDRLLSLLAGGAAGAALPTLLSRVGAAPESLSTPDGIRDTAKKLFEKVPEIQRANFLWDGWGLPANMIVGPYGSATFGAIEAGLSGDPRGWVALKSLGLPSFARNWLDSLPEAATLLKRGEAGRTDYDAGINLDTAYGKAVSTPALWMTSGDLSARRLLMKAGFSDDEARAMTLTSEPMTKSGEALVNLSRSGGPLMRTLFPFVRTPVNIAEQGLPRIPGVGALYQFFRENPDSLNQIKAQQLIGTGVTAAAYGAGNLSDEATAKNLRRYVTNAGGRYSLPAAIGFAAGEATRRGQDPVSVAGLRGVQQALPLPTIDVVEDLWRYLSGGMESKDLPRGAVPSFLRPYVVDDTKPATMGGVSTFRFRQR